MTVTNTTPVSGPHTADGLNRDWQFTFKVVAVEHMALRITDADGLNPEVITAGFTIAENYLDKNDGGYVRYPIAPEPALTAGRIVRPYRVMPYMQPNRIGNQGGYYPQTHEQTFDLLSMQIQQCAEALERSVKVPIGEETDMELLTDTLLAVAAILDDVVVVANNMPAIVTVSSIHTEVVQVAAIDEAVATVAAINAAVTTVAGIDDDVTAVAAISAATVAVAAISEAVTIVAAISAATVAVAAISEAVEIVAANIADVQSAYENAQAAIAAKDAAEAAAAGVDLPSILPGNAGYYLRVKNDETGHELVSPDQVRAYIKLGKTDLFVKPSKDAVAFIKTGAATASIKAGVVVEVGSDIFTYAVDTAITMPALAAGNDAAIWVRPDGQPVATLDFVSPPVAGSRRIGGFHYAPGGNAAAMAGGNTVPQINEYSLWDLKFRPACVDPRGMALVAGSFWTDIYLLGVDHHINGTSRFNVTIADHSSPPKVPLLFGGNGTAVYSSLNWWEAAEVMQSHGKELLDIAEFGAAMYGTTEATSGTTDPVSTILRAAFTSKWGIMLATGSMWVWAREFGGPYGTAAYAPNGRGSTYNLSDAAVLGGGWVGAADSGSRASRWDFAPSYSNVSIGARGRSDLVTHV